MVETNKTLVFFRKFGTAEFVQETASSLQVDPVYIFEDPVQKTLFLWNGSCQQWTPATSTEIHGLQTRKIGVYPFYDYGVISGDTWKLRKNRIQWGKQKRKVIDWTETLQRYDHSKRITERNRYTLDEQNISKSIFQITLSFNWPQTTCSIHYEYVQAGNLRNEEMLPEFSIQSYDRTFDFETGQVTETSSSEDSVFMKQLPEPVLNVFLDTFARMRNAWAGRTLSAGTELSGIGFASAATSYPFEPNLHLLFNRYRLPESVKRAVDRKNPNGYIQVCDLLHIESYRTLHRLYLRYPQVLVVYFWIKEAGFQNVDVINEFLGDVQNFHKVLNNPQDFRYFVHDALRYRSDKAVYDMICKSDPMFYDDFLNMYHTYRNNIAQPIVDQIMKDGITGYQHNVLANMVSALNQENVSYSYGEEERKLEGSFGGYEFRLPEDSNRLTDIGVKLHNCVASYAHLVENKTTLIVYAQKNGEYAICIEVGENEILQALGNYNARLTRAEESAVDTWAARNHLIR